MIALACASTLPFYRDNLKPFNFRIGVDQLVGIGHEGICKFAGLMFEYVLFVSKRHQEAESRRAELEGTKSCCAGFLRRQKSGGPQKALDFSFFPRLGMATN